MLHPQFKRQYFKAAKWEPAWIKTAEEIVRGQWEESYAVRPLEESDMNEGTAAEDHNDDEVRTSFISS